MGQFQSGFLEAERDLYWAMLWSYNNLRINKLECPVPGLGLVPGAGALFSCLGVGPIRRPVVWAAIKRPSRLFRATSRNREVKVADRGRG